MSLSRMEAPPESIIAQDVRSPGAESQLHCCCLGFLHHLVSAAAHRKYEDYYYPHGSQLPKTCISDML